MIKLVLLRHGQSTWNKENKFTGWTDVPLTDQGREEAKNAGLILKKEGYSFNLAFTNELMRAIDTLKIVLDELGLQDIEVQRKWRLNERHYGALQGLNKAEMMKKYGNEQVHKWRRGYETKPPQLTITDNRYPGRDSKYKELDDKDIPLGESLQDTVARVIPCWEYDITPALKAGKKIIVTASHNSLRAFVKHLENIPDKEIPTLTIPLGIPLVYELDDDLKPIKHYYLGSEDDVEKSKAAYDANAKSKS